MFKIAIDGYMGSGKSTVAKELVKRLNDFKMLDTGAIFRAIAYAYKQNYGTKVSEDNSIELLKKNEIAVKFLENGQNVFVNDENVTPYIRTEEISQMASKISVYPDVRAKYLEIAKDFSERYNCIMEGRDIGSVVMPDADVKIFLTADEIKRAERRHKEACAKDKKIKFEDVLNDLRERDKRDTSRKIAPLKPVEDSIIVDNTDMTIEETVDFCQNLILSKINEKKSINIAIDGYVCSGKSSIARELAKRLNFCVFDTGAVYRGIACAFKNLRNDEKKINERSIKKFADQIYVNIKFIKGLQHVFVNGVDYTADLRTEEISALSAKLSPFIQIREKVLKIQKEFAKNNNTVMEGRDIGSEVLPNADYKFFVVADEKVRAQRRYDQQKMLGNDVSYEKVLEDLRDRDYLDVHREHGAIKQTPDAYVIDTTNQTVMESVEKCLKIINIK